MKYALYHCPHFTDEESMATTQEPKEAEGQVLKLRFEPQTKAPACNHCLFPPVL